MGGDIVLIYRVVGEEDLIFRAELERIAARRGIALHFLVGDHRDPACRDFLCPDHLSELVPDIADREVYLCRPPAMIRIIQKNVRAAGVPRRHIYAERFALQDRTGSRASIGVADRSMLIIAARGEPFARDRIWFPDPMQR